ncbi:hypothetical protein BU26DRAFT_596557 [Trematosphaeria pertusa]|uniref:Mg2+ transporter zinc transport protein n=1 Tax=Trematosphaeria pertusa TaxID=390896 RepID=A0A6A6IF97_9PLEO|nr:uncharacterized protein BU26DRAFT_596557 [Trematosphaeria pertusa]KAF2248572.1 hypothetical protein BU26DRAFT_596557 [Trematosphaeria pertusa]
MSNERGAYAFFRGLADRDSYDGGYGLGADAKYSLTDHVMIGLALKCLEELGISTPKEDLDPQHPWFYYSYEEVKRKTLKRFTTVNPISKKRTLATSRWPNRTRFLLHSKDTFLFFAVNMDYFNGFKRSTTSSTHGSKASKSAKPADAWRYTDDRWAKLLEAQAYHDEFQYLEWEKPLWYALVFVLVCTGRRVNNQSSEVLINETQTTLLGSSWYNGMFPGLLGRKKKPVPHERESERDSYWFSTFEISNILWTFGSDSTSAMASQPSSTPPIRTTNVNPVNNKDATGTGQQVEKHAPFINLSPPKDLLGRDILSDDWLQDSPAVLKFDPEPMSTSAASDDTSTQISSGPTFHVTGVVIDVPRYSLGTEISKPQVTTQMFDALRKRRTVWDSKKRIIWLINWDEEIQKEVYDACSEVELKNAQSFFGRHVSREKYFLDSATATLNEWETELHLSFFRISKVFDGSLHPLAKGKFLASTAMSFRFSGDFSDRYWTCYFLEHGSTSYKATDLGSRLIPPPTCGIRGDLDLQKNDDDGLGPAKRREKRCDVFAKPWQQRRVLELLIYVKMLEELHHNTDEVLSTVKELALRLDKKEGADPEMNPFKTAIEEADRLRKLGTTEDYTSIADEWQRFQQILLVIEENLTDNIEKIKQWDSREGDRQSQQPRWTDRDKRLHFTTILRLRIMSQRQAKEIERLNDDVRAFRESLPRQLETIREDINFRGSQNINLFTYVTVVFLPLGFATGLLSMSGAPDHALLMNLVTLSLGALGITLFALLNAEAGKAIVTPPVKRYLWATQMLWKLTTYTFFYTIVERTVYRAQYRERQQTSTNEGLSNKNPPDQRTPNQSTSQKGPAKQQLGSKKSASVEPGPERPGQLQTVERQPAHEQTSKEQQQRRAVMEDAESTNDSIWPERWRQKYNTVKMFSYRKAVQEAEKQNKIAKRKLQQNNRSSRPNKLDNPFSPDLEKGVCNGQNLESPTV